VAGNIVLAWILTLPCSAAVGALAYGIVRIFGTGTAGPIVVIAIVSAALLFAFGRRASLSRVATES
jgi:PiT family inorganic phosphate transporter